MQITMQTSIAGHADPRYGLPDFGFAPGQVVDVHPDLAAAWVAAGIAAPTPEDDPQPSPNRKAKAK